MGVEVGFGSREPILIIERDGRFRCGGKGVEGDVMVEREEKARPGLKEGDRHVSSARKTPERERERGFRRKGVRLWLDWTRC